jgi:glycosyltransferase involved in cell wall biosynthesis
MSIDVKDSVFIWHGGGRGGAEKVMVGLAEGFRKYAKIKPVLGVFKKNEELDFEQIVVRGIFPKKLTGYDTIFASLRLRRQGVLDRFNIVLSHGGGFWKTRNNFYVCHEAGDLDALAENLPLTSRIVFAPLKHMYISAIAQADLVVSATRECDQFLERHGIRYVKGRNFIDTKFFRPGQKKPKDVFRVLFVGRNERRKNLPALKEACRKIEGVELLVVGTDGRDEGNVKYLGQVSDEKLAELYKTSHLFALPSLWEGFPISVLEAMASQTPVLAGIRAVPSELRKYVITLDPRIEGEIERKLRWAIENYQLLEKIARKARKFVEENFNKERVIEWEVKTILKCFEQRKLMDSSSKAV